MRYLILWTILCSVAPAYADVVEAEPESCPPGSTPATAHTGPYCRPAAECASDTACGEGSTCDSIRQCVETRGCGGLEPPDAMPCTLQHVVGPCDGDGTCAVGECLTRDVCEGATLTGGGCGCSAGEGAGGGALAIVIAFGLMVARRSGRRLF